MKMVQREQQHKADGVIPSLDEHIEVRTGTSGVTTASLYLSKSPALAFIHQHGLMNCPDQYSQEAPGFD